MVWPMVLNSEWFYRLGGALTVLVFLVAGVHYLRQSDESKGSTPKTGGGRLPFFWGRRLAIPGVQSLVRLIPVGLFLGLISFGLYSDSTYKNSLAVWTWSLGWALLIVLIPFAGKIFCFLCPFDFFASLVQFGWMRKSLDRTSLNWKWPSWLRNDYLAVTLLILISWLDLALDLRHDLFITAILGLLMLAAVVLSALTFEGKSFCRFGCPVGRISGLYSRFSFMRLGVRSSALCQICPTKECVKGTTTTLACPTFLEPYKMVSNDHCILCMECVRSCQKNNLTLTLAPPMAAPSGLEPSGERRESFLIVALVLLVLLQGFAKTPVWADWATILVTRFKFSLVSAHTLLMSLILVTGFFGYSLIQRWLRFTLGLSEYPSALTAAFIPITLSFHMSFSLREILGPFVGSQLSGQGSVPAGIDQANVLSLTLPAILSSLRYGFLGVGFCWSAKLLITKARALAKQQQDSVVLYLSHLGFLFLLGLLALWCR